MLVVMLQNVLYNIGGNIGRRWLRAARPRAQHRGFVPQHPLEDVGHQYLQGPGATCKSRR